MDTLLNGLRKGELMGLTGRRGARIASRRGSVWLTQEGDPKDVVIERGEVHELDADGPVLIQALEPACVAIEPAVRTVPGWWRRLRAAVGDRTASGPTY